MACSHCNLDDHDKRKCPDIDRPSKDCYADRDRERRAYFSAANVIAELLGDYPPERRVELMLEAFDRSRYRHLAIVEKPLRARETAASQLLKSEISKWESAKVSERQPRASRRKKIDPQTAN